MLPGHIVLVSSQCSVSGHRGMIGTITVLP